MSKKAKNSLGVLKTPPGLSLVWTPVAYRVNNNRHILQNIDSSISNIVLIYNISNMLWGMLEYSAAYIRFYPIVVQAYLVQFFSDNYLGFCPLNLWWSWHCVVVYVWWYWWKIIRQNVWLIYFILRIKTFREN